MTKGLFTVGIAFCDEVERLAPLTRPGRIKATDLTAALLTVRAERLRPLLERARVAETMNDLPLVEESVLRIIEIVDEWRGRGGPSADAEATCALVREQGELFLSLSRRARTDVERASRA